jgi:hypothetical protein
VQGGNCPGCGTFLVLSVSVAVGTPPGQKNAGSQATPAKPVELVGRNFATGKPKLRFVKRREDKKGMFAAW